MSVLGRHPRIGDQGRSLARSFFDPSPVVVPRSARYGRYIHEVLADSPVAFWPFDEQIAGLARDISGNGKPFTSQSGSFEYGVSGPLGGRALRVFPLATMSRTTVSTATNDFTIEFWMKNYANVQGADSTFLWNGYNANRGIKLEIGGGTKLHALAHFVGYLNDSVTSFQGGTAWRHVVVRRKSTDSNRWSYWVNGAVDNANAGASSPIAPDAADSLILQATQYGFAYDIALLAYYDTAISDARVAAHYNAAA